MTEPSVTVVMATYNRGRHILPSVRSVLAQSFSGFELLVVGDGCTDDTAAQLARIGDPRIRYVARPDRGGSQSFANNTGIEQARSGIIAYLGHDDLWEPFHLQDLMQIFRARPEIDFAIGGTIFHPPAGIDSYAVCGLLDEDRTAADHFCPPSGMSHRRGVPDRIGAWRAPMECRLPVDQDFQRRAVMAGMRFASSGRISVHKFAAGQRYLSYLRQESDEQEAMLRAMTADDHATRVAAIIARSKAKGGFMSVLQQQEAGFEPGELARQNLANKGLQRRTTIALGQAPLTLMQEPGPCALDWTQSLRGGFRFQTMNPRPRLLVPISHDGPVELRIELCHPDPMAIAEIRGAVNDRPFQCRTLPRPGTHADLVLTTDLLPDGPSLLTFELTPEQCTGRRRGLGVGQMTLRAISRRAQ